MTASPLRTFPGSSEHWSHSYVGLPFSWHGYDFSGVSCWGLVCLVYEKELDIRLERHDWEEIPLKEVKAFDVLHMWGFFNRRRRAMHCGVVVRPGYVLHAEEATGSAVSRYTRNRMFENRVIGAYRCRST